MSKSWPRDSNHNASGKPGAVHTLQQPANRKARARRRGLDGYRTELEGHERRFSENLKCSTTAALVWLCPFRIPDLSTCGPRRYSLDAVRRISRSHAHLCTPFCQRNPPSAIRPKGRRPNSDHRGAAGGRCNVATGHRSGAQRAWHSHPGRVHSLASRTSGASAGPDAGVIVDKCSIQDRRRGATSARRQAETDCAARCKSCPVT
jgi:hypothetical protein